MLHSLYIKNFAIIDEINVKFENGLNIITGETGAGKTLIIKAIQLLLGERFTGEVLRTATDQMVIEGVFIENEIKTTIRRLYQLNGQSRSFINDEPIKQKDLLNITRHLVDLHGQHEHQNLLDVNTHIQYLDAFGMYSSDLIILKSLYNERQAYKKNLDNLKKEQNELEEKKALHKFQLNELEMYPLSEEHEKQIADRYQVLANAEKIKDSLSASVDIIDNGQYSILKRMNELKRNIHGIENHNDKISEVYDRISSNLIELDDILKIMHDINMGVSINNAELKEINEILNHFELLKRKYGGSMASVVQYYNDIQVAEEKTDGNNKEIQNLSSELLLVQKKLSLQAELISGKRHKTALELETSILDNLQQLNMPNTDFKIRLSIDADKMNELGIDICEYFISTNKGETSRPLSKIISGVSCINQSPFLISLSS